MYLIFSKSSYSFNIHLLKINHLYTHILFLSFSISTNDSTNNGILIFFRFLVLCSYQPETLTVRAGISLPTSGGHHQGTRGQAHISMPYEEENNNYLSGRRSRTGRVLQKPEALGKILSNFCMAFFYNDVNVFL